MNMGNDMTKRQYIFLIVTVTIINVTAAEGARHYYLSDPHFADMCRFVSNVMFICMFLIIAEINLANNPRTAVFCGFVAGFFASEATEKIFSLAVK